MGNRKSDLPGISGGDRSALMHGAAEMIPAFSKDIYIGRQKIVGDLYQGEPDSLIEELHPGDKITLLREPENEHDKRAVLAQDEQGRTLGYIPQSENLVMSALMDHGKVFYGVIPDIPREEYENSIPIEITVDLYMRELAVPGEAGIPLHESDGSYAVVSYWVAEDGPERIEWISAIKVINGEERGLFDRHIRVDELVVGPARRVGGHDSLTEFIEKKWQSRDEEKKVLKEFSEFVGCLPLVSHGVNNTRVRALEEAYGVLLGKTLTNKIIDTEEMAKKRMPGEPYYLLNSLVKQLGIQVQGATGGERRCRKIWELYRRLDKG